MLSCSRRGAHGWSNVRERSQLEVLLRRKPKPRLHNRDRILWVWMRWLWPEGWTRQLGIVQPETVIGWHRRGWRLYWSWRSRSRLGRPRLSPEVRELIARMSRRTRFGAPSASAANSSSLRSWSAIDRFAAIDGEVPKAGEKSDLENVPAQPDQGHLGGRPIRGPDDRLPDFVRVLVHQPRAIYNRLNQKTAIQFIDYVLERLPLACS